ncbi:unnamed protein product, partial [Linum tenue]
PALALSLTSSTSFHICLRISPFLRSGNALNHNKKPHHDYGIEVMYKFALDSDLLRGRLISDSSSILGRFWQIFHQSIYRVLLGHKERKILSCLLVELWKNYGSRIFPILKRKSGRQVAKEYVC